jgi:hypothetical protein
MKPLAWARAGTIAAAGVFASFAAHAQVVRIADEIRPDGGAYRGSYNAMPGQPGPADGGEIMAPREVIGLLRADGYSPIGPAFRRGWIYTVAVINPDGDDGRLVVDARTGDPIRFIPAMRMDARMNEELDLMYGPPGPPPAAFASDMRRAPRPPANIPRVAKPHPQTAAKPADAPAPKSASVEPKTAAPAPVTQSSTTAAPDAVKPEAKPAEAVTAQAAKPEAPKPAESKPAQVELKPTQDMPPVQPLD